MIIYTEMDQWGCTQYTHISAVKILKGRISSFASWFSVPSEPEMIILQNYFDKQLNQV